MHKNANQLPRRYPIGPKSVALYGNGPKTDQHRNVNDKHPTFKSVPSCNAYKRRRDKAEDSNPSPRPLGSTAD